MTAGLSVFKSNGTWQVNSDIKTSTLVFKTVYGGPFTTETWPMVGTVYYFDIDIPASVRSVFFQANTLMSITLQAKTGTTHRFKITATGTITIWGFTEGIVSASTSGLQLFDASGSLTFDSNSNFQNISAQYANVPTGTTYSWPSTIRQYAAGIGNYPKRILGVAQAGVPYYVVVSFGVIVGPYTGAAEMRLFSRPTGGGGQAPPPNSPAMSNPNLMVIDVTNM